MKKSAFFILLTAAIASLASCEKCYLYRDKWVGKYQCKLYDSTFNNNIQERRRILKVTKEEDNGIFITDGSDCHIQAYVLNNGTILTDSLPSFSGSFIGKDSLTFAHTFPGYWEGKTWYHYYCHKLK